MRQPDFIIGDPKDPYLKRWWIIKNRFFRIYLHQMLKDDEDRALHDHPWYNLSIILKNGYEEITPVGTFTRKFLHIIFRKAEYAHRLKLINNKPSWSLFMTGPKIREWGFLCKQGWRHWKEFTKPGNKGQIGRGCGEE